MAYQQNDQAHKGTIFINAGAINALTSSVCSLLPVGIERVEGIFDKGDMVRIADAEGNTLGVGVAQYGAETANTLKGQKGKKPLVHYDYLYILS